MKWPFSAFTSIFVVYLSLSPNQGFSQEGFIRANVVAVEEDTISIGYREKGNERVTHRLPRAFLEDLDLRPGLSHVLVMRGEQGEAASSGDLGLLTVRQYRALNSKQRRLYIEALQELYLRMEGLQTYKGEPVKFSGFFWPRAYASEASNTCAVGGQILARDTRGLCPTGGKACPENLRGNLSAGNTFHCGILFGGVCVDRFESTEDRRVGSLTSRCLDAARGRSARVTPRQYETLTENFFPQFNEIVRTSSPLLGVPSAAAATASQQPPEKVMSETIEEITTHFEDNEKKNQVFVFASASGGVGSERRSGQANCRDRGKAYSFVRLSDNPLGFNRMVVGPSGVEIWQDAHLHGAGLVVDNFSYQQGQGGVGFRCEHGATAGADRGWVLRGVDVGKGTQGGKPVVACPQEGDPRFCRQSFSANFQQVGSEAQRHPVDIEMSTGSPMRIVTSFVDHRLIVECTKAGSSPATYRTSARIEKRSGRTSEWQTMEPIVVETQEESCYRSNKKSGGSANCYDSFGFSSGYMNLLEANPKSDVRCPSEFKPVGPSKGTDAIGE